MAIVSSESSKLLDVRLEPESEDGSASNHSNNPKTRSCVDGFTCTFRVRIAVFIGVLLIQLPLLAYYLSSSSQMYFNGVTNSYHAMVLHQLFGKENYDRTDSFTRSFAQNLTTVYRTTSPESVHKDKPAETATKLVDLSVIRVTQSPVILNQTMPPSAVRNQTDAPPPQPSTVHVTTATTTTTTTKPTTTTPAVVTAKDGAILPECPAEPPNLQGRLKITFDDPPKSFSSTAMDNPLVEKGGHGKPPYCVARHKVAIIIPFRDREEHLRYFLQYMHPVLQRQQVDYQIFIVNQAGKGKFNRAKLMNIGYKEALKIYPFECFSFHDVDLVLEDDRSLYWCSDRPRHMSAGVDKFNYVLPYGSIFGGVTLLSKEQMEAINGFSNVFWGWGGEDDDVYNRLAIKGYKIIRYPMNIARYKMITHKREKGNEANPKRFEMIRKTKQTYQNDGLNTLEYEVVKIDFQSMYTNITVDVKGPA